MITLKEMIAELEEFYENAGFSDVYERKLKDMGEDEIRRLYKATFEEDLEA